MNQDPGYEKLIAEGLQASREDKADEALAFFAQASVLVPASGVPHFLIGSEHAAAGNLAAAETEFAQAVRLAPGFALARYQLGLLQFSTSRPALALVTWQPLFALPSGEPLGHFVRGFEALARDNFDAALEHYREGLACHDINHALAGDILRVVAAVEDLPGRTQEAEAARHVLLSGYAKGLH